MKALQIKRLRRSLNLTREQFADRVGVHWRTIMRWEKGETRPCDRHEVALEKLRKEAA